MKPKKLLELDGRTGEGGGQLVRIACALAAVTSQPIRIHHVRGNRPGPRRGGLKSQHVTAIQWLADATQAEVSGLEVGSRTLEFRPTLPPPQALQQQQQKRRISITADSGAASALLIFQAVFPFLLFAGSGSQQDEEEPIELEIHGGTNVSFSPSYEYLDQILLPALQDHFGIHGVERRLVRRRWSQGSPSSPKGTIWFRFRPLRLGQALKPSAAAASPSSARTRKDPTIRRIDATVLAPAAVLAPLRRTLVRNLETLLPDAAEVDFVVAEDSGHGSRLYVLLVAHSEEETTTVANPPPQPQPVLRWGRDWLYDRSAKRKTPEQLSAEVARRVCGDLAAEVRGGGAVDEHLQDQLVVFQALTEGRTSFPRAGGDAVEHLEPAMGGLEIAGEDDDGEEEEEVRGEAREEKETRVRKDEKTDEPFGEGSMHTRTARWVASELLPTVQWFNGGSICDGAGLSFS